MDDMKPEYSSKRLKPWVKRAAVATLLLELSGCAGYNVIKNPEKNETVARSLTLGYAPSSLEYTVNADGSYTVKAGGSHRTFKINLNPHRTTSYQARFWR